MVSRWMVAMSGLVGLGLVGAALLAPVPVGACSIIHPCDVETFGEDLRGFSVELIDGDDAAEPPEWVAGDARLIFDGWGSPEGIRVGEKRFTLWRSL